MPRFNALVRVIYNETWSVEANDETEARAKIAAISEDVDTDDMGGEVVDWEITSIKPEKD